MPTSDLTPPLRCESRITFAKKSVSLAKTIAMQVTIDKYGRILIPKRIREQLGIQLEQPLELRLSEDGTGLEIGPVSTAPLTYVETPSGFPVFHHPEGRTADWDVVAQIKQDREERDRKTMGWR